MFETITLLDADEPLLAAVRLHQGKAWSTNADVISFRTRLLELQNYRCAYCQIAIDADELGHRELDHILPKLGTQNCKDDNARSNDYAKRQYTYGYPQFTYEPLNLVVACKICNAYKRSFDPLRDRTVAYAGNEYPDVSSILWFYPYAHCYSDHISLSDNWLYTRITDEGEFVIKACRLDRAEALSSRTTARALIKARQAGSLRDAVMDLTGDVKAQRCSFDQAAHALAAALAVDQELASMLIKLWIDFRNSGDIQLAVKAEAILLAIMADERLNTTDAARAISAGTRLSDSGECLDVLVSCAQEFVPGITDPGAEHVQG